MPADPPAIVQPAPDNTPDATGSKLPVPPNLAALTTELESTRQILASIRRERDIQRALFEAGANDLDIGAAMIERDLAATPDKPIPDLVTNLKQRKPNLFAGDRERGTPTLRVGTAAARTSVMSARPGTPDPRRQAAERAATGDRASLMHYLRLRRAPAA